MFKMSSLPVKLAESHFTAASNELHIFSSGELYVAMAKTYITLSTVLRCYTGLPYITVEDQQQLQIVLQELATLVSPIFTMID